MTRLCFGTFGRVLRECKKESVNDTTLIGELTRTIDPECEYAESDGTAVSKLLSCTQGLSNGNARRVGQKRQTETTDFSQGYLTNRLSNVVAAAETIDRRVVAQNIADHFLCLLDEDRKDLIVPALFDIMASDTVIDTEKQKSFEKYVGQKKTRLLSARDIVLPELLAGILLYTVIAVPNKDGENCAKLIDRAYVDRFKKAAEAFKIREELTPIVDDSDPKAAAMAIQRYLEKVRDKYENVYTLISKSEPVPFYSIFVCNNIEYLYPFAGSHGNTFRADIIENATVEKITSYSKYIILSGTGGIGKTMMMRHLLFDAIIRYPETGILPIFFLLKDFDDTGEPLVNHVCRIVSNYGTGITNEKVISLLEEGKCLLMFDGLDEISRNKRDQFYKLLEAFIDRFTEDQFIISTRPNRRMSPLLRFKTMYVRPFSKDQAIASIDKLVFRPDDDTIKERFKEALNTKLFRTHKVFAENPLLLTIMLMTFEKYEDIPSKMHTFYRKAFDALAQEHDANKGYSRPLYTGLEADDFALYLAEFCALTYCDEKFELTKEEVFDYFNQMNILTLRNDPEATPGHFLDDLCENLCMLYFEDEKYHFTHRSFQEYFCAFCFNNQMDEDLKEIGDIFENMRSRNFADKTFSMLYDMKRVQINRYMFAPFLQDLFKECDREEGYWTFLVNMYPVIAFSKGETDSYDEPTPVSYLYEFIKKEFFDTRYDFSSFPECPEFVTETFVCIEKDDDDTEVVVKDKIPTGYIEERGYPDEVGWIYEIDTDEVHSRQYRYKQLIAALEDDNCCLKKEYKAAHECLRKLLETAEKKSNSILKRLI